MSVRVSREEYFTALDEAIAIANNKSPEVPQPPGDKATEAFLAWAYDSTLVQHKAELNMLDLLIVCDNKKRETILTIIAGGCAFGRPSSHPRITEIMQFHFEYAR